MREDVGINVYLHIHGNTFHWPEDPFDIPDKDPGDIVDRAEALKPGGNRVRAYLDVVTPDDTSLPAIERYLRLFIRGLEQNFKVPVAMQSEQTVIRFGCDLQHEPEAMDYIHRFSKEILHILERYRGTHKQAPAPSKKSRQAKSSNA